MGGGKNIRIWKYLPIHMYVHTKTNCSTLETQSSVQKTTLLKWLRANIFDFLTSADRTDYPYLDKKKRIMQKTTENAWTDESPLIQWYHLAFLAALGASSNHWQWCVNLASVCCMSTLQTTGILFLIEQKLRIFI